MKVLQIRWTRLLLKSESRTHLFTFRLRKSELKVKNYLSMSLLEEANEGQNTAEQTAPSFCLSYTVGKPARVGSEQEWQPNRRKQRR